MRLWCTINEIEVFVSNGWFTGLFPPGKAASPLLGLRVTLNLLRAHARIARLLAYLLAGATFWLFDLASGAVRDADTSLADVAPRAACPRWSPWPWPCPRRYRGRHEDEARLLGGDAA